jgi:hypothetical protein
LTGTFNQFSFNPVSLERSSRSLNRNLKTSNSGNGFKIYPQEYLLFFIFSEIIPRGFSKDRLNDSSLLGRGDRLFFYLRGGVR